MTGSVLVTGGAGFIGSNFVLEWLARVGTPVVNLDKLTYSGNRHNLAPVEGDGRYTLVEGDIGDRELVASILAEHRPSAVVNFAAESHVDRSIDSPGEFIQSNIVSVYHLLEESRRYWLTLEGEERDAFRFLHVSTDEVYGSLGAEDPPFTEHHPYQPNSPYSASKAASDHLVRAWYHTYGLPVLTTNCSNNYGPYQFPEKLIPLIIFNALEGRPLPVYGDGSNIRDWLYVVDHCSAIRRVLEAGQVGETYNIGGNFERTNLDVVKTICSLLDELVPDSPHLPHEQLIEFVTDRPGHDWRYAIDPTRMRDELGWQPAETFTSGMRRTVSWYLEHGQALLEQVAYHRDRLGLGGE